MKIKRLPEDFTVEELVSIKPEKTGDYSLFKVTKRSANTMDVVRDMARRLGVQPSDMSYCGLKDRHSLSVQYVAAKTDKRFDIKARNYEAVYIGRLNLPLEKRHLIRNRFRVTVRDLEEKDVEKAERELELVKSFGFPNYYDDQRFGSARHGKGFFAKALIKKRYIEALRLLLATPSRHDEKKIKRFKRCVRDNWGNWERCIELAVYPYERRILRFLSKVKLTEGSAKRAIELIDHEFLLLFLHAYQSYIWNETLKGLVERLPGEVFKVKYSVGYISFYREPGDGFEEVKDLEIPFPGPKLTPSEPWGSVMEEVLRREGIEGLKRFRTRIKGGLFETHRRRAVVFPEDVHFECGEDEVYPGKKRVTLSFLLPPGSYATILLKRIFKA